jgi:hypothetical protein
MGMLISSLSVQGSHALSDNSQSESSITGSVKGVIGGTLALSTIALGVLGGGYCGGIVASAMTYNYYRRNGYAKESIDLRKSMIVGGITGSVISGYVATALSVNALDLF